MNNTIYISKVASIILLFFANLLNAQTTSLVSIGANGQLVYTADSKGNVVPDYSGVGYMNSDDSIPTVPVVLTVNAVAGDNTTNIQNAINTVAAMPLQSTGFRGAIKFTAGTYNIASPINITTSGIILRGDGATTIFKATGTTQYNLINIIGASGKTNDFTTQKAVTNSYVPYGSKTVTVTSTSPFQIGDWVYLRRQPNSNWLSVLGMDTLTSIDPADVNWTTTVSRENYERKIVNISGNQLTFDAPIMDIIDPLYATGSVFKFVDGRIEKCGVENMAVTSTYTNQTDEQHGWNAIYLNNLKNAWVKNVDVTYFGYSAVNILESSSFITVDNCTMYDAVSTITGSRRYSFNIDGQRSLVKNCKARNGRHDFVTGQWCPGPNVFYNCSATLQQDLEGPHQRWATGILYDNITGDKEIRVENRLTSGSGHGWAGAQVMIWNSTFNKIVVQDVPTEETNFVIGCIGNITNAGMYATTTPSYTFPIGVVQSPQIPITAIPSLFLAQLADRTSAINLPLSLNSININLIEKNCNVKVIFSVSSDDNVENYFIQRNNGANTPFVKIATIIPTHLNTPHEYVFEENIPSNDLIQYNVVANYFNQHSEISNIVTIKLKCNFDEVFVYPNPSKDNMQIEINSNEFTTYQMKLVDITGKIVLLNSFDVNIGENIKNISIESLASGLYNLILTNNTDSKIIRITKE